MKVHVEVLLRILNKFKITYVACNISKIHTRFFMVWDHIKSKYPNIFQAEQATISNNLKVKMTII